MAITYSPEEYLAALGDLGPLINSGVNIGGIDNLNQTTPGGNSFINNITNIVKRQQEQQNQLGPDDFGSYVIPPSDPTYSTGQQYARSIAGGIPMSQIMASGVSYSPEQPGGYTQQQLNEQALAQTRGNGVPGNGRPGSGRPVGTGIGGYSMPYDRKQQLPPLNQFLGQAPAQAPAQAPGFDFSNIDLEAIRQQMADSGFNFTNLFGMPAQQQLNEQAPAQTPQEPDDPGYARSGFGGFGGGKSGPGYDSIGMPTVGNGQGFFDPNYSLDKLNIDKYRTKIPPAIIPQIPPAIIPQIPSDNNFSIENLDLPDFSNFVTQQDLPVYDQPDLSQFITQQDLPAFNPKDYRDDFLSIAREGIEMPIYQAPDLFGYDRFSVNQLNPKGLF